jgi:hypothetical protein
VITTQKVIEILEAKNLPFTSIEVEGVIRRHDLRLEGSVEDLIEEVVAEGVKRSVGVLESFSDTFKVSLPIGQMEELFWRRGWVYVRGFAPLEAQTRRANGGSIDTLYPTLSTPHSELPKKIELYVRRAWSSYTSATAFRQYEGEPSSGRIAGKNWNTPWRMSNACPLSSPSWNSRTSPRPWRG